MCFGNFRLCLVLPRHFLLHFSKHFNGFIEAMGITTARTLEPPTYAMFRSLVNKYLLPKNEIGDDSYMVDDVHLGIYPKIKNPCWNISQDGI